MKGSAARLEIGGAAAVTRPGGGSAVDELTHHLAHDRQAATRILAGDEDAFEEFVRAHHGRVARIAGRFFRRADTIEEIVQEVFVKAYSGMPGYRGEVPLGHWLARITVNACYDQLRRQRARPEVGFSQLGGDPEAFVASYVSPDGEGSAAHLAREEARRTAEQILARLPAADRLVLTLTVLEGMAVAEVADLTGWSVANVKVRAFRARNRMRRLVAGAEGR